MWLCGTSNFSSLVWIVPVIWNFADILTAAVFKSWWGLKVRMEKFAKWQHHTLIELYLKHHYRISPLHSSFWFFRAPYHSRLTRKAPQGFCNTFDSLELPKHDEKYSCRIRGSWRLHKPTQGVCSASHCKQKFSFCPRKQTQ